MLRRWLVFSLLGAAGLTLASCAATGPENPLTLAETAQATTQMSAALYSAATQAVANVQAGLPAPVLPNFSSKTVIVNTPTAVVILRGNQQIIYIWPVRKAPSPLPNARTGG